MAIEKNSFKVSRFDSDFSPSSRKSMSSEEDELQRRSSAVESDDDDEFDDADSGAGSDDFDLLELGETGVEFCQIGNQTCSIPFELYDLHGLEDILSIDVWNECLSEEERLGLTKYLPDMDQETFMLTMAELFTGSNFHFGSPITKLFDMLKGGLCEPRVALYREGWNFFQKRKHYHLLRKHQNTMVSNVCQIRDAWQNCRGYSIEERLRVLNIMKSQKSLMHEMAEDVETDSSEGDSDELLRNIRVKDRQIAPKMGHNFDYGVRVKANVPSQRRILTLDLKKHGKQNPKGNLKLGGSKNLAGKELVGRAIPAFRGGDMNAGAYSSEIAVSRHSKATGYEVVPTLRMRDHMRNSEESEEAYAIGDQRDRYSMMDGSGISKIRRKQNLVRENEFAPESSTGGFPVPSNTDFHPYGKRRDIDIFSDAKVYTTKPPTMRPPYELSKKARYQEDYQQFAVGVDQMKPVKGRLGQLGLKGIRFDSSERAESFWNSRGQDEAFAVDSPFRSDDWSGRSKKWKVGKESPELNLKSFKTSSPQINDRFLPAEYRANPYEEEKFRGQNGGPSKASAGGNRVFNNDEETESESSDQSFDDEDNNPLLRSKIAYPVGMAEASQSLVKSGRGSKMAKLAGKKDMDNFSHVLDEITSSAKMAGGYGDRGHSHGVENYSSKGKQKGKMQDSNLLNESPARILEDSYLSGTGRFPDDDEDVRIFNLVKNGHLSGERSEMLHIPSTSPHPSNGKKNKGGTRKSTGKPTIHYCVDEAEDSFQEQVKSSTDVKKQSRFKIKAQKTEPLMNDHFERSEAPLLGCSSAAKKRKARADVEEMFKGDEDNDLASQTHRTAGNSSSSKKKAKKKVESEVGLLNMETFEPPALEMETVDVEPEIKAPIKPFPIITPTVHSGFSFSVIHLLSAIRVAMVTPLPEDTLVAEKVVAEQSGQKHEGGENGILPGERAGEANVPSLTVHEIVNRVRSNPGDPCILETQEPLQDLVRGVLKIFSSKTAPLGAKAWKPLAIYERSTKSWAWLGPVSLSSMSDHEAVEEVISPEAWSLPHKTMVKLVDSFANWLKSGQETLQQIGSLPLPPVSLMQLNLDEKERFRDLRAQKSLNTINPSSEEVRIYFRQEEVLRYLIPDRAFSYTAADGKRSIVAPLRRCGGKPTSKARDHFMLKRDRPPHVTILCLVRDAAARLPGSIGTRADVCTLIRDSQYIVEEVSDAQVNQVVSGALDRLHYERDPCVQFDGERKLWVYLHREREEEDFEDDGTSSTKKWKRQKKDAAEPDDQTAVTVAYRESSDQPGFDLCSDLNAEPSNLDDNKRVELGFDDAAKNADDHVGPSHGPEQEDIHQDPPMAWEALEVNSIEAGKLLCQENSTNEDFDEDAFNRERPIGLLSASLS